MNAPITQEQADAIFSALPEFHDLDGCEFDPERGFIYFLIDASMVLIGIDGSVTRSED